MALMVTRREILAQVNEDCSWSVEETRDAIAVRFPGTSDLDLVALLDAWRADKKLSWDTLGHCLVIATAVARKRGIKNLSAAGAFKFLGQDPREKLLKLKTAIQEEG